MVNKELLLNYGTYFESGLNLLLDTYAPFDTIDVAPMKILDIGCGSAREVSIIRKRLRNFAVFNGIDTDFRQISMAQAMNLDDSFYGVDAREILPLLQSVGYDALILFHPEMKKPELPEIVSLATRCIRSEGLVLATTFAHDESQKLQEVLRQKDISIKLAEQNNHVTAQDFDAPFKYVIVGRKN